MGRWNLKRMGAAAGAVGADLPSKGEPQAPIYWRHEPAGMLTEAIGRYMAGNELTVRDVAMIGGYCRHWINAPLWDHLCTGEKAQPLAELRAMAGYLTTQDAIDKWMALAFQWGMDPL